MRDKEADLDTVKFPDNNLPDIIVGIGGEFFSSYFVFVAPQGSVGLMHGSCIYAVEESTNIVYKSMSYPKQLKIMVVLIAHMQVLTVHVQESLFFNAIFH